MALTSLEYLKSRAAMPSNDILSPPLPGEHSVNWSSDDRKDIHEDYWGRTILDFVTNKVAHESDFQSTLSLIEYHEYLTGSSKGVKFVRKQKHWARAILKRPQRTEIADLAAVPFVPFLFEGRQETISLRVMVRLRQHILGNLIAPLVQADTALFDLGSGWGRHALIFAHMFPELKVHAGELSLAGQRVTEELAMRLSLSVTAFGFNYLEWQNLIQKVQSCPQRRIIIFSSHSIEQVTFVDHAMWVALLQCGKEICFVHIEPVGWQIAANSASEYSRPPERKSGQFGGYNKNLIAVIDSLDSEGVITGLDVIPDYIALSNVKNSGTLVRFRAAS